MPGFPRPQTTQAGVAFLIVVGVIWAGLYALNEQAWTWLFHAFGWNLAQTIPSAIHFFFYDSVKILLLLIGMIFSIALLRTSLRPETVREYLLGRPLWLSLVLAALLGAVTPFCSCSSIPVFIGFVAAGVPLSATLAFLVASPLVNEVAVVMLARSFGWPITLTYVASGLGIAILLGYAFSLMKLDDQVKDFVRATPTTRLHQTTGSPTLSERIDAAVDETAEIVGRIWIWALAGVATGAFIHGWIPADFLARHAGPDNPFAVTLVTLLGALLYSNAAGVIPIAEALWSKGMGTGTVLSFMMATVALSLPEFILLKQVLKPKLLTLFFGFVTIAIMALGFGLNIVF